MKKGFTAVELLIIVAITILVLSLIILPLRKLNESQALLKETGNIVSILNHARSLTLSSKGGKQHGVRLASTTVTLFDGPAYIAGSSSNVTVNLHPAVSILNFNLSGGVSDVIFSQLNGTTNATGTIIVAMVASTTVTRTITVNSTGIIDGMP